MATDRRLNLFTDTQVSKQLAALYNRSSPDLSEVASTTRATSRRWELLAYFLLISTAAGLRLWDLGARAMHHDESLHAFFSWNLFTGGGFAHTPMMHGPLQFQANAAIFYVLGDSDVTARLLYVVLGTALVGLPWLFRRRLGTLGALTVSVLLTFSPAMLYFSRFARNDILMAAWTLGLVISMWRYIDEGKNRYLYSAAALLALAYATKETTFIVTFVLSLYLIIVVVVANWPKIQSSVDFEDVSPPVAIGRILAAFWSRYQSGISLSDVSRPASFLILLVTLSLPQWASVVSLFQDTALLSWTNLVLANPEGTTPIGAPSGGGLVIAAAVVMIFIAASVYGGAIWKWSVWWRCAAIFYTIWVLLYSTFFTNIVGIGSGMWQSLGYWGVQQGEARGGQPWYYYFVITPIYEFLPLIVGVIAAVYYIRRRDRFGIFLVYWAVITFAMYTVASEKMPWLLVNITLPLIVLSGKFLADVAQQVEWKRVLKSQVAVVIPLTLLTLVFLWQLAFFEPGDNVVFDSIVAIAMGAAVAGMLAWMIYLGRVRGAATVAVFALVPLVGVMMVLSVRTGIVAAYKNGDIPVEMIVYTQTSNDVTRVVQQIKQVGDQLSDELSVPITVDQTSGFTWPWAWYLRNYAQVNYPTFNTDQSTPDSSVLLVHSINKEDVDPMLSDGFSGGELVKHRAWFPEGTYRGLTVTKFVKALADRDSWRRAMDYFLYRKGVEDRIGSEDAYVYFNLELPDGITDLEPN